MINILGIAGSGKSTQGQLLAKRLDCPWISMGQLLRDKGDEQIQQAMMKGEIVNVQKSLDILGENLKERGADKNEVIVDGWPRAMEQATWMVEKIAKGEIKPTGVIHLQAHQNIALERLKQRGRKDDTEEAIKQRFKDYQEQIPPIINFLKENGVPIFEINADDPIEVVEQNVDKALNIK